MLLATLRSCWEELVAVRTRAENACTLFEQAQETLRQKVLETTHAGFCSNFVEMRDKNRAHAQEALEMLLNALLRNRESTTRVLEDAGQFPFLLEVQAAQAQNLVSAELVEKQFNVDECRTEWVRFSEAIAAIRIAYEDLTKLKHGCQNDLKQWRKDFRTWWRLCLSRVHFYTSSPEVLA